MGESKKITLRELGALVASATREWAIGPDSSRKRPSAERPPPPPPPMRRPSRARLEKEASKLVEEISTGFPKESTWSWKLAPDAEATAETLERLWTQLRDCEEPATERSERVGREMSNARDNVFNAGFRVWKEAGDLETAQRLASMASIVARGGGQNWELPVRSAIFNLHESHWPREALGWLADMLDHVDPAPPAPHDWAKLLGAAAAVMGSARYMNQSHPDRETRKQAIQCSIALMLPFPQEPMDAQTYAWARQHAFEGLLTNDRLLPAVDRWMALEQAPLSWDSLFRAAVAAFEAYPGEAPAPPLTAWLNETRALRQKRMAAPPDAHKIVADQELESFKEELMKKELEHSTRLESKKDLEKFKEFGSRQELAESLEDKLPFAKLPPRPLPRKSRI